MKILAFSGSPRKNGNTEIVLKQALEAVAEEGLETGLVRLADYKIEGCTACEACRKSETCPIDDDLLVLYEKMKSAGGIIIGSPVYFGSATPHVKALMDRTGYIAVHNGYVFDGKVGGPVAVAAREGANFTIAQIAYWFYYNGLVIPGSSSWNVVFGEGIGQVLGDAHGMAAIRQFGRNVARLLKRLNP